jgi:hypothetical protein
VKYALEAFIGVVGAITIAAAGASGVALIAVAMTVGILIVVVELVARTRARNGPP